MHMPMNASQSPNQPASHLTYDYEYECDFEYEDECQSATQPASKPSNIWLRLWMGIRMPVSQPARQSPSQPASFPASQPISQPASLPASQCLPTNQPEGELASQPVTTGRRIWMVITEQQRNIPTSHHFNIVSSFAHWFGCFLGFVLLWLLVFA